MSSLNNVQLIGHLGQNPEGRQTPAGKQVCSFSVATNENWTDKAGQKQSSTEWHRIVAWDKTAELCVKYLQKGRQVFLEGRLQTRKWTDKDGIERYTTEVVANNVIFLGGNPDGGARPPHPADAPATGGIPPMASPADVDTIPF